MDAEIVQAIMDGSPADQLDALLDRYDEAARRYERLDALKGRHVPSTMRSF